MSNSNNSSQDDADSLSSQSISRVHAFKAYLSTLQSRNSESSGHFGSEIWKKCEIENVEILNLPKDFDERVRIQRAEKEREIQRRKQGNEGDDGQEEEENHESRIWKGAEGRVVYKLTVDPSMCNLSNNMHGGCQAYLLDVCTSLAIVAISHPDSTRWTTSGVTTDLQIRCFAPIPLGKTVRIVCTTLSQGSRMAVVNFRIEDYPPTPSESSPSSNPSSPSSPNQNDTWVPRLYAQGTHAKMDTSPGAGKNGGSHGGKKLKRGGRSKL